MTTIETITETKQWTIKELQSVIEYRQKDLESKPLFNTFDRSSQIEDLQAIAPHFYFFVLAFQDMLRLTHEKICAPTLKEIALNFVQEDAGHEEWYLFDVEQLGCTRDVRWLFGNVHQPVRDFAYELTSYLFNISDDRVRIVFPLVLEATGVAFFKSIVGLVRRSGYDESLRYFGSCHQKAEMSHNMYKDGKEALDDIEFDENAYREALALIHQCFNCFEGFADYLEQQQGDLIDDKR